ncbi:MoaD/ThiS family protein [Archaeoglobus veneficus]|uniref:MoaD family protein n=1 Tax=Archaeoglobus veneficus (strain DSM 11195 / SNP6) TaxID=693661 RepID=F2KRP4_ARCVS|nr:MoaD/ThiS family protein [Archaeoglobus veneficus]AEA47908.1 MoaD family protein [Archaeoglobus veneficus SNP6]
MKVKIELFATFRDKYGTKALEVECDGNLESAFRSAAEILGKEFLEDVFDENGKIRQDRIITVNGRNIKDIGDNVEIRDGDVIAIFPPIAGG